MRPEDKPGTLVRDDGTVMPVGLYLGARRCPCRTDPRAVDYRIVSRFTGQRVSAGDSDAMTVCSGCGEEIEL